MPEIRCEKCEWEGDISDLPYASPWDAESQYCPICEAHAGPGGSMHLIEDSYDRRGRKISSGDHPNYMFGDVIGDHLAKSRSIDRAGDARDMPTQKTEAEILEANRKAIEKMWNSMR